MIEKDKLKINSNAKSQVITFGPNQLPLLIVDDFYHDPEYVRELALNLHYIPYKYHPGDVAGIDLNPNSIVEFIFQHYPNQFNLTYQNFLNTLNTVWHFTQVHKTKDQLLNSHCIPHVDPLCLSGIIYLNLPDQCQGGTGFYLHNETQVSEIISINIFNRSICGIPSILQKLKEMNIFKQFDLLKEKYQWKSYSDLIAYVLQTKKEKQDHIRESNQDWTLLYKTDMQFNRMVIFPSYSLHSLYMKDEWFNKESHQKRLTQNIFFFWPRENFDVTARNPFVKHLDISRYY